MERNKKWYAVLLNKDDDWGTGSRNFEEAKEMAKEMGSETIIAEIDEFYDEKSGRIISTLCTGLYYNGEDF